MLITFKKYPLRWPVGTFWKTSSGSFKKDPHFTPWSCSEWIAEFFKEILIFYPLGIFWVNCWVLFKSTHILPTGQIASKLVGSFRKHPEWTCWVCLEQIAEWPLTPSECAVSGLYIQKPYPVVPHEAVVWLGVDAGVQGHTVRSKPPRVAPVFNSDWQLCLSFLMHSILILLFCFMINSTLIHPHSFEPTPILLTNHSHTIVSLISSLYGNNCLFLSSILITCHSHTFLYR